MYLLPKWVAPVLLLLLLCPGLSFGQDLATFKNRTPVRLTGGVRVGTQLYNVTGIDQRAAPLQLTASGRLNLSIYEEFNIKVGFALGRQRPDLQFPVYRQFGISPQYKWITLHAGHRNMNFSRYTLNNHTFLGGGVELNPGKLRVAAMYGRLRQGLREVSENIDLFFRQPLYDRFARGGRVGFGTAASHFDIIYFHGEDRDQSVALPDSVARPGRAENLVLGLEWKQAIGDRVQLYAEAAASGFSRDVNSDEYVPEDNPVLDAVSKLFAPRFSTQTGLALRAGANYRHPKFNVGADYERIDPGFESMGTYFLNGDWENIRGNLGFGLFRNRLRLQGSLGIQRNNLFDQRAETSERVIASGFVNLRGGKRWNLGLQYANFTQDHRPNALVVFNDTLRIASTTENTGGNWTWTGPGGRGRPQGTVTVAVNHQSTNNDNPLSESFDDLRTLFASTAYSLRLGNGTTTLSAAGNYTRVDLSVRETVGYGGTIGWRQSFAEKKAEASLSNTFNLTAVDGASDGFSNALRGTLSYNLSKRHALSVNISWLERRSDLGLGFTEQRAMVGYNLTFPAVALGKKPEKKKKKK